MKSDLASLMHRYRGWKLWTVLTLICVVVVELLGTALGLILVGRINVNALLVGGIAAGIVAPSFMVVLNSLLSQARLRDEAALRAVMLRTEGWLASALEATRMVCWEIDIVGDRLNYDEAAVAAIGFAPGDAPKNLAAWQARVHPDFREEFLARFRAAVNPGGPIFDYEYRFELRPGIWGWLHTHGRVTHRDAEGRAERAAGTTLEITARKAAESEREANRSLLQATLDSTDEGILMVAEDGRVLTFNQRFLELWKVPSALAAKGEDKALLGHVLDQLVDPAGFLAKVESLYGSDAESRDILLFKDGRVFARYTRGLPVDGERGRIWCFRDITEQARAQSALAEREAIYRSIVTQANDAIVLIDTENFRFVEFNDAACEGLGYTRAEYAALRIGDVQADMDQERIARELPPKPGVVARNLETRHRHKDGTLRDVSVSLRCIELHGHVYMVGTWTDITERKQAEQRLQASEEKLLTILDNVDAYIYLKDTEGRYLFANRPVRELWKAEMEHIVGHGDEKFFDAATSAAIRANDARVLEAGEILRAEETNTVPATGATSVFLSTKLPLRDEDGRIYALCGISTDITARKAAEEEVIAARNRLRATLDALPDLLFEIDDQDRILDYHSPRTELLAASPDTFLGQEFSAVLPPDVAATVRGALQQARRSGSSVGAQYDLQLPIGVRRFELAVQRHGGGLGGMGFTVLARDITDRAQIQEALHSSEERSRNLAAMLRLMCDNVPDMIWAKDLENRYIFANKAVCEGLLCAADTEEPVGRTDLFFAERERESHPDDPDWHTFGELCQDTDVITLARGEASHFEEAGNVKGKPLVLEVSKAPFINEHGEVIGTVGSGRDVTERKQADAELDRHRLHLEELVQQRTSALLATEARASHILDASADGLYGVDADGRITFINPAACKLLGIEAEQVIGHEAHAVFHHTRVDGTPYPAEDCPVNIALHLGNDVRIDDEVFWHADGHAIPVMYAIHPIVQDGHVTGAVTSIVDMSELRAAADARESALLAAENLARVRREFLANMSHEIRTPLNGVLGFAEIGSRNFQNPDKAKNAFTKILASGKTLLGVIDEVLDFSKIEAGKFVIDHTPFVLREVIHGAVDIVRERAQAKQLALRVDLAPDLPRDCLGDAQRLEQVLLNLLGNAVKFTETGSVTLAARREGNQLVFAVTDTGIGMDKAQLAQLFNPFHQADASTTRKFGGTGLGLAISKRILELLDGEIRVESELGKGSRFEFRVPYLGSGGDADAKGACDPVAAPLPPKPLTGISILAAEDDPINSMLLEENLLEEGARVVLAGDGRIAVERVIADGRDAYDIVLMDIQMPEMDGYEATRRILELAPDLPVIGQTAHAFGEERDKCFAAGMVAHIAKPIDPKALVHLILRHTAPANKDET